MYEKGVTPYVALSVDVLGYISMIGVEHLLGRNMCRLAWFSNVAQRFHHRYNIALQHCSV